MRCFAVTWTCQLVDFDVSVNHSESKGNQETEDLARELIKVMEHGGNSDINHNWNTLDYYQEPEKETGGTENSRLNSDSPNNSPTAVC